MHWKQKIAAIALLHSWSYHRTVTISELQCRSGDSPQSPPRQAGAACVPSRPGWMEGKEEIVARHTRHALLLDEREDRIR